MSRGWRFGLSVVAVLVGLNLLFRLLDSVTGGTPGGPQSSSYATSDRGAAAYADRKSTRLNSSHIQKSRMPSSA